jgi:hypothetical protein
VFGNKTLATKCLFGGLEAIMAMIVKTAVFWNVALSSSVDRHRRLAIILLKFSEKMKLEWQVHPILALFYHTTRYHIQKDKLNSVT